MRRARNQKKREKKKKNYHAFTNRKVGKPLILMASNNEGPRPPSFVLDSTSTKEDRNDKLKAMTQKI